MSDQGKPPPPSGSRSEGGSGGSGGQSEGSGRRRRPRRRKRGGGGGQGGGGQGGGGQGGGGQDGGGGGGGKQPQGEQSSRRRRGRRRRPRKKGDQQGQPAEGGRREGGQSGGGPGDGQRKSPDGEKSQGSPRRRRPSRKRRPRGEQRQQGDQQRGGEGQEQRGQGPRRGGRGDSRRGPGRRGGRPPRQGSRPNDDDQYTSAPVPVDEPSGGFPAESGWNVEADSPDTALPEAARVTAPKPPEPPKDLLVDEEVLFTHPYLDDVDLDGVLVNTVTVRFRDRSRIGEFDAGDILVARGQKVVVETEQGLALGTAAAGSTRRMLSRQLPRVVRALDDHDMKQEVRNACREREAFDYCRERINHRGLPMKLIRVEYLHGGNKAVFFFASETRVDFRDLVKDLAQRFRTRIVMRQVGVRDESRMTGGIGSCGCELCCSSCLSKFEPVSIRMAKDQNIVLNPQKVSGQCGRLKCCLVYELEQYVECKRSLPKGGRRVVTPDGAGRVQEVDILRKLVRVYHDDGTIKTYPADQIKPAPRPPRS